MQTPIRTETDFVAENKNMRTGIDIIRACGLHCDELQLSHITAEMILNARNEVHPTFRSEIIDQLKPHEHLALAAVALTLRESKDPFTNVEDAYENYRVLCEEYERPAHVKMSFRKYLRNLTTVKAINSEYLNPTVEKKGRQLRVHLNDIEPNALLEMLRKIIPNEADEKDLSANTVEVDD